MSRAERRARERVDHLALSTRTCFNDGYGAVRVKDGHLIRSGEAFVHASPAVCAGLVRAITSQARESVRESLMDFLRITWIRTEGYLRLGWSNLISFLRDDGARRVNTLGVTPQASHSTHQRVSS